MTYTYTYISKLQGCSTFRHVFVLQLIDVPFKCDMTHSHVTWLKCDTTFSHMGWLRLVGSLTLQVSFAKEPYKRDYILQKRPIFLRSLQVVATPYVTEFLHLWNIHVWNESHLTSGFKKEPFRLIHIIDTQICDMTHLFVKLTCVCLWVTPDKRIWKRAHLTHSYGVPTIRRLPKIIGLFYKALLQKRPIIYRALLQKTKMNLSEMCMGWLRFVGSLKW